MRRLAVLLAGAVVWLSAIAQEAQNTNYADILPGTWALTTEIHGARLEARSTFTTDGHVEEQLKVTQDGTITELFARGRWEVDGDEIVTTYTESNAPGLVAVGSVERDKITYLDEHQLSLVDGEGTAATMHRVE